MNQKIFAKNRDITGNESLSDGIIMSESSQDWQKMASKETQISSEKRDPLPYAPVWLESITMRHGAQFHHGLRKYSWDIETGEILDENNRLTAGRLMKAVVDLSRTHRIPRVLMSRIFKALKERQPPTKTWQQQIETFQGVMLELVPWIPKTDIEALTRAL